MAGLTDLLTYAPALPGGTTRHTKTLHKDVLGCEGCFPNLSPQQLDNPAFSSLGI